MELLFMGTGTSQGVPMIACTCAVCASTDPRNRRTRTSAHVVLGDTRVQIDAGPEFRVQCLEHRVSWIDAFILTHGHADHITGMDDLRRFCDLHGGSALAVYSTQEGLHRVRAMFPYADGDSPRQSGYPAFRLQHMPSLLQLPGGTVRSVLLPHGPVEVLGLVFEERGTGRRVAYYTDCKELTPEAEELARGADLIVLDGLRPEPHPTHMHLDAAISAALRLRGGRTFLTHLTHSVDHDTWSRRLPPGVELAHDGLRIGLD
jgi:phosphoribosyl 1,2-cyclic phosphate phosphodiesterase